MHTFFRLLLIGSLIIIVSCHQQNVLIEQRILSFGTLIDINIAAEEKQHNAALKAIKSIENLLQTRHHQWHSWLEGDLSNLNKNLKDKQFVSQNKDLIFLVSQSKSFYTKTNGLFNPALGSLISAWGFHDNSKINEELINEIQKNIPTMDDIVIHGQIISSENPYAQLDFGGIAKGLAINQIKDILKQHDIHHYLINFGGDLSSKGTRFNKQWTIGIQNPFQKGAIGSIKMTDNNLFTSGNYERYASTDKSIHHIIDPRTGKPSNQANAVTVLHSDSLVADVAATALMIAKPNEWQEIATRLNLTDFLIISSDKTIWVSHDLFKKISFNTELKVHIIKPI